MASYCRILIYCAVLSAAAATPPHHQLLDTVVNDHHDEDHGILLKRIVYKIGDLVQEVKSLKNENRLQMEETIKLSQKIDFLEGELKQVLIDSKMAAEAESEREVLLAIGGYNSNWMSDVELYDPRQNQWRRMAPLPQPRSEHSAVVLNGTVYVCGANSEELRKTCLTYDPAHDKWSTGSVAPMLEERADFGMILLNNEIYALAGFWSPGTAEKYNPVTNSWSRIADLPINVSFFGAAAMGGALYVAGGSKDDTQEVYDSIYKYDPTEDFWIRQASMRTERNSLALVPTKIKGQDFLAVVGGHDYKQSLDTVELFTLDGDGRLVSATGFDHDGILKMTARRHYLAATAGLDGQTIYAVGGASSKTDRWTTAERLQLTQDGSGKWSPIAPMLQERDRFSLVAVKIPNN